MEYIEFGSNKTKVSKVVLGLMRIPELRDDKSKIIELLNTAHDLGINFLDIADCYTKGFAETLLGDVFNTISHFVISSSYKLSVVSAKMLSLLFMTFQKTTL